MEKIIQFLLPALLICCWGCSSDSKEEIIPTPEPENTKIEITSNQPVMEQTGGTATVSFTTNAAWTASVSATTTWITVSPASGGKGTHTLTVTTVENDTYDERNASVTIKAGNVSKNFTVTQKQKNALTVTSNKVELEAEGGEFSIEVKANVDVSYKIEEAAKEWIMESKSRGLSTTTLIFKAKNNESEETRQATITLKGGDNLTETVTVYQAGKEKEILLLTQKEYTVDSEGDTLTVELKSNTEYEMVWPEVDWVSEASSRAVSSYTHYIAVAPNETYSHRKTQIVFRSKTSEMVDTLSIFQSGKEKKHYSTPQNDRDALVILFDAMNGKEWNNQTNWGTDKPLNEWYGVETNEEGNVTKLDLGYNNLSGYIPEEIGYLSHLKSLELRSNNIGGTLPESIGKLTHLWEFYLSGNPISGRIPESIGNLKYLNLLYMESNQFEGELPESFFNLEELRDLWLSNNQLKGQLSSFTQLKNLVNLGLRGNQFTGSIPDNIASLNELRWLEFSGNPLSSSIPNNIGKLTNLSHLYLNGCQLEGSIPQSIGNLSNLVTLNLGGNQLSGSIPSSIGNLTNLEELSLSNNQLSGSIPDEIVKLVNLYEIKLHHNPDITSLPQNTSILQLPCWQYMWWDMIRETSIKAPIEERLIPGPYFEVTDLDGNTIIAKEEYKKNNYTILIQWDPEDGSSKTFISTLVSMLPNFSSKGLGIIGWCSNWERSEDQLRDYITQEKIPWRNFKSTYENGFAKNCQVYPAGTYGLTVHVVNSDNRIVFSSLVSDVNTLPDFLEEAFAE